MIDTHCHLTSREFAGREGEILALASEAGVSGAITIATTSADCIRAAKLVDELGSEHLWFSAGVHPLYSDQPIDWNAVRQAASHPRCVAWGELGLDNHYDRPPRAIQDRVLAEQIAFIEGEGTRHEARGTNGKHENTQRPASAPIAHSPLPIASPSKPIIVHCRDAVDDLLAVFRGAPFEPTRYVFHCFTGTADEARRILDFGAWISFTGVVTFHNANEVVEAAKIVPADRIMAETDSPYLSPEPVRKIKPNVPAHVMHVGRKLAAIRNVDFLDFERQLDENASRFFSL